jgi:spore germination cell wall hydrolase CwlJ-like protein
MLPSRIYWAVAHWRRGVQRWWHAVDKAIFAALLLLGMVLGGFGFALLGHFAREDERRESARESERNNLDCLARNVYFEARGEPVAGMYAVAEVTMNRKASRLYPVSVCGVVYQQNWDPLRGRFVGAFSWTEFNSLPAPSGEAWERAVQVAEAVYFRRVPPTLQGALHFHATHIKPEWAKERRQVARIGRHVFYR